MYVLVSLPPYVLRKSRRAAAERSAKAIGAEAGAPVGGERKATSAAARPGRSTAGKRTPGGAIGLPPGSITPGLERPARSETEHARPQDVGGVADRGARVRVQVGDDVLVERVEEVEVHFQAMALSEVEELAQPRIEVADRVEVAGVARLREERDRSLVEGHSVDVVREAHDAPPRRAALDLEHRGQRDVEPGDVVAGEHLELMPPVVEGGSARVVDLRVGVLERVGPRAETDAAGTLFFAAERRAHAHRSAAQVVVGERVGHLRLPAVGVASLERDLEALEAALEVGRVGLESLVLSGELGLLVEDRDPLVVGGAGDPVVAGVDSGGLVVAGRVLRDPDLGD